ncbi:alpha/beta fold hydrolase [Oceanospirillum linum]|uniref:Alpha/beta hydrolase n=1 Tax=Oceanospirillum linum TaxID=966 RepID=A0A1T1HE74_OCELI|nr:alpha/beta fold hydrolase [Oceanospirillum linum]OOV88154.1 alpha/beta hydrolase [Oceanospirillum linum]SEF45176.1 esterase [Oleiphilus messinensis]SMP01680.1 esterase [Oceanospirillum linum]
MSDRPTLFYTEQGEGFPLIIIHGLFGSADNWRTLSKKFAEQYRVIALDLRNHGRSPHVEGMSYPAMASDVLALMDSLQLEEAHILGHSMGGKVAMQLALNHPERIEKLVVADIAPVEYGHGHDEVLAALYAVQNAGGAASRKEADTLMAEHLDTLGVRQFLSTNLEKKPNGKLGWRMGLEQINADYDAVVKAPTGQAFSKPSLFIRGELSHYVEDGYQGQIDLLFPQNQLITMSGCGHWLHAEKPLDFLAHVQAFLNT